MKPLLIPIVFLMVISCNNASDEKYENKNIADSVQGNSSNDTGQKQNPSNVKTPNSINVLLPDVDTTSDIKIAALKQNGIPEELWFDTKCAICDKVCCSPCLQKGDYKFCVKTPNHNCLACGHASDKHVPSKHIVI